MVAGDSLDLKVQSDFQPFKEDIAALQVHTIWLQKAVNKEEKFTEESQAEAKKFEKEALELQQEIDALHAHIGDQRAQIEKHREQEETDRKLREEQDEEAGRLHKYIAMMENEAKQHRESLLLKLDDALVKPRREAAQRMELEEEMNAGEKGKQAFQVAKNEAQIKELECMIEEKSSEIRAQQERYAGNKLLDALSLLQFKKLAGLHREALAQQRHKFEEQLEQQRLEYEEILAHQAEEVERNTESEAMQLQEENDAIAAEIQLLLERLEREKKRTEAAARRADAREAHTKEVEKKALEAAAEARAENAVRRAEKEQELLRRLECPEAAVDTKVETPRAAFPVLGVLRHVEHQLGSLNGPQDILGGLNAEIAALEAEMAAHR